MPVTAATSDHGCVDATACPRCLAVERLRALGLHPRLSVADLGAAIGGERILATTMLVDVTIDSSAAELGDVSVSASVAALTDTAIIIWEAAEGQHDSGDQMVPALACTTRTIPLRNIVDTRLRTAYRNPGDRAVVSPDLVHYEMFTTAGGSEVFLASYTDDDGCHSQGVLTPEGHCLAVDGAVDGDDRACDLASFARTVDAQLRSYRP